VNGKLDDNSIKMLGIDMADLKRIELKERKIVEEENELPIPRGTGFVRLRFG